MKENFNELTHEELIERIKSLKQQLNDEKFGLYFDRKKNLETIVERCKEEIPILKNDKNLSVLNGTEDNLIIEGDNFAILLSLLMINPPDGMFDLIYIDPPYNTQNKDFVYNDTCVELEDSFRHSKWLSFMEKRLNIAKELMKDEALIFISIDDNEQAQLKVLCDSIFGDRNFVTTFIIDKTAQGANQSASFKTQHEFLHCYAKNIVSSSINFEFESERDKTKFKYSDEKGWYAITNSFDSVNSSLDKNKNRGYTVYYNEETTEAFVKDEYDRENGVFGDYDQDLIDKGFTPIRPGIRNRVQYPWNWTSDRFLSTYKDELVIQKNKVGSLNIYHKNRYSGVVKDTSIKRFDTRKFGNGLLVDVLGKKKFDYPKSLDMMKWLISKMDSKETKVLDFFAGSGTTGHAVLELNREDGGNRTFVLATNNENNIMTEVCYPRLKTVVTGRRQDGTKYGDGVSANLRYFKSEFVKDNISKDQTKYNLVEKCMDMITVYENTFDQVEESTYYTVYKNKKENKLVGIFTDYFDESQFKLMINTLKREGTFSEIIIYVFSLDNEIDCNAEMIIEENLPNATMSSIPNKMYEVYKKFVADLKRTY